jgi:uncharacterized membrane protein
MSASRGRLADTAAIVIIAGMFGVSVYRAATQSLTCDEAYSYARYIDAPAGAAFTNSNFSANDHVLFTFLTRIAAGVFGHSELAIRLVSLLGGLGYLGFAYRLARRVFHRPWMMLLAVALLALSPFVVDYLSAARGYGMALGLFLGALYLVFGALQQSEQGRVVKQLTLASFLLGLSIAANFVFLLPSLALAGTVTALRMTDVAERSGLADKFVEAIESCWTPMIVTAFILLVIPFSHAHREDFNYGADTLSEASLSLVQASFFHQHEFGGGSALRGGMARFRDLLTVWMAPAGVALLAGWLAVLIASWLRVRRIRLMKDLDRVALVVVGTMLLSFAGAWIEHAIFGLRFPLGRTAVYFVPLAILAWLAFAARCLESGAAWRAIGMAACVPAILALAAFLNGFTTEYYFEWRYDSGTKRIFSLLREQGWTAQRPARLGVDSRLWPSSNYYRQRLRLDWLQPATDAPTAGGGFDFYILLLPEDQATFDRVKIKILYRDAVSGEQLGIPAP